MSKDVVVGMTPDIARKVKLARVEYVSAEGKVELDKLADAYNIPISVLDLVHKTEKWDNEKETYRVSLLNDVRKRKEVLQAKAELNTLSQAVSLQGDIFKKIQADIRENKYIPTVKDFTEISKITLNLQKQETQNVNSNNKILNITLPKPVEEMSYDEIVELESTIAEELANEENE